MKHTQWLVSPPTIQKYNPHSVWWGHQPGSEEYIICKPEIKDFFYLPSIWDMSKSLILIKQLIPLHCAGHQVGGSMLILRVTLFFRVIVQIFIAVYSTGAWRYASDMTGSGFVFIARSKSKNQQNKSRIGQAFHGTYNYVLIKFTEILRAYPFSDTVLIANCIKIRYFVQKA